VHPKVVQERLGHSTISIALDTYSHVIPTMQRGSGSVCDGGIRTVERRVSAEYHRA
jgi:hypothetical protein